MSLKQLKISLQSSHDFFINFRYLPIKLQNQITDTLQVFVDRKDRRKIESYNKERLIVFHSAIMEDDGIDNIEEQILKLQETMRAVNTRIRFPEREKTPAIIYDDPEILVEEKKVNKKRMYIYREGTVMKADKEDEFDMEQVGINISCFRYLKHRR
jgi:hypothetical protein